MWTELARLAAVVLLYAMMNALLATSPMLGWIWLCRRAPGLHGRPVMRITLALGTGLAASYLWLASGNIRQFDSSFDSLVTSGLVYVAWWVVALELPRRLVRGLRPGTFALHTEALRDFPRWFSWRTAVATYVVLWAATIPSGAGIGRSDDPRYEQVVAVAPGLLVASWTGRVGPGRTEAGRHWYAGIAGAHRFIVHDEGSQ